MEYWRRLQDISYYEADSFQESFHKSLKNILTDFEISLIRERLSKNKRVQNEFASFL